MYNNELTSSQFCVSCCMHSNRIPRTVELDTISVITLESATIYDSYDHNETTEPMIPQQFHETHESTFPVKHRFHVSTSD